MEQKTFLDLINQSMQKSAQLVHSSLGRSSYLIGYFIFCHSANVYLRTQISQITQIFPLDLMTLIRGICGICVACNDTRSVR